MVSMLEAPMEGNDFHGGGGGGEQTHTYTEWIIGKTLAE